ncbi:MAG: aldo/keto reductase [Roseiarcus sp.]
MSGGLDDKSYGVVEALARIASELDTTVARVALAWVRARPGVTSPIIGARTRTQLEDNVKALEVELTADQTARLDALTAPTLPFPIGFLSIAPSLHSAGATVNGEPSEVFRPGPQRKAIIIDHARPRSRGARRRNKHSG